jgi:pilus assembly protein Flp/PilA
LGAQGTAAGLPVLARRPVACGRTVRPALGRIAAFLRDERGATAIEYSIIAALISIMIIGGLTLIGPAIMDMLDQAGGAF